MEQYSNKTRPRLHPEGGLAMEHFVPGVFACRTFFQGRVPDPGRHLNHNEADPLRALVAFKGRVAPLFVLPKRYV